MPLTRLSAFTASLLLLAGCGLAQQFQPTSQCDAVVPDNHRPAPVSCDASPPSAPADAGNSSGPSTGGAPQQCSSDSDCTSGPNGRCLTGYCHYNQCTSDSDCGTKTVCDCRNQGGSASNVCLPGNCAVDSDCGTCGYCSPSKGSCNTGYTTGYYCHTSNDECLNDSDCKQSRFSTCDFDETLGHWKCQNTVCGG